jgi:arginine N-succinyltransferase
VKKMLTAIGFTPVGRIDPFDGGPHFEADTETLWPVTKTRPGTIRIVDPHELAAAPGESCEGLIAAERRPLRGKPPDGGLFRCVQAEYCERGEVLAVAAATAAALGVADGDEVHALALARHTRL